MLSNLVARARSLWKGIRRRPDVESEMAEEFRLHQEMRAADLVRAGLSPAAAARQARLEFGSAERYKDEARASRGLRRIDDLHVSWLDVKLGIRMLAKYPGITLVGGLAMAFAIWMGAGAFELVTQVMRPRLPLPAGDRIVALRNWDVEKSRPEHRALHDLVAWREELRTVRHVGAYRTLQRNLVIAPGNGEPAEVAEISAAGFRVARVPALLGRPLVEADERAGAPPVLVIGHDVWRARFESDPRVVGRVVQLGRTAYTIVGVMPERFAFPVAHDLWVPLRVAALEHPRRAGPAIQVFGRLAPGVSMDEARAELTTLGRRAAAEFRDTHEHLQPQVMPFAKSILDLSTMRSAAVLSINIPLLMLLVLICGNVALLMFARAATRESELVVRSALGASRGRIVMQLFAEALVLGTLAALVGLAAAGFGLRWVMGIIEGTFLEGRRLPFWFQDSLSPTTILYAALLTLVAAAIAGIMPALKVTHAVGTRLKQASAGAGGLRFGGVWTAIIVAQVAVTIAFPVTVFFVRRDGLQIEQADVGMPAERFLSMRLEMDREPPGDAAPDTTRAAFLARYRERVREVTRRLTLDPGVLGVTFADRLPGMYHPYRLVEVDDGGAAPLDPRWAGYRVSSANVDADFFRTVGVAPRAGRTFHPGDLASDARAVIVNESFVKGVFGGRNPIGRRVRYIHFEEWDRDSQVEPGPWHEIVGVVPDMGMAVGADVGQEAGGDPKVAGFYHPVAPDAAYPVHLAVHVRGSPATFGSRLRAIVTDIDPTLRLYDLMPLDGVNDHELRFLAFWFRMLAGFSAIALTLSLAGIYSVMTFTVSRRTREIGIRVALGAPRRRVIAAVFRRPLLQLAGGLAGGVALTSLLLRAYNGGRLPGAEVAKLAAYALVMTGIFLLACIVPTRRALRVEPTEALRDDG